MARKTVEITKIEFDEKQPAATAHGYLRVNRTTVVRFDTLLSRDDMAELEPILERISWRVRGYVGEAMQDATTNQWDDSAG